MTILTDNLMAKPWYREPWPWILMAGPLMVIVASFCTLWLAIKSDDGLVADDYYKRGLAINQMLSRTLLAERLALSARVTLGVNTNRVRLELTGRGRLPADLRLRLVHPTRAVADQVIVLDAVAPGIYEGDLTTGIEGRRVVMLEDLARTWRLAGEASSYTQSVVELTPQ